MNYTFYDGGTKPMTYARDILRDTGRKIKSLTNSPIDDMRNSIDKYITRTTRARSYIHVDNKITLERMRDFNENITPRAPMKSGDLENICDATTSTRAPTPWPVLDKLKDAPRGCRGGSDPDIARRIENIVFLVRFCNNIYNDIYMYADSSSTGGRDFILKINDYKFNIGADMLPENQKYAPTVKIIPSFIHRSKKYKMLSKRDKYDLRRIGLEILLRGEMIIDPAEASADIIDVLRDGYAYEYIDSESPPLMKLFDILVCCPLGQHYRYRFYIK